MRAVSAVPGSQPHRVRPHRVRRDSAYAEKCAEGRTPMQAAVHPLLCEASSARSVRYKRLAITNRDLAKPAPLRDLYHQEFLVRQFSRREGD